MNDPEQAAQTPPDGPPKDFRPEGAEWEPAGSILKKPPAPTEQPDAPTEGDDR